MQGSPPQHHRFDDPKIPAHITYAYKKNVEIVKNDDFYILPEGEPKKIDLLFVIASAPVQTAALPESGSLSYSGLTLAMELAMKSLSRKFPSFFPGK